MLAIAIILVVGAMTTYGRQYNGALKMGTS